jgi:DNA-binding transcriptional regulator YiaG
MIGDQVREMRYSLNMSQAHFANVYRLGYANVCSWEQGRRHPEAGTMLLLRLIAAQPHIMASLIAELPVVGL